jgi:hypothetical protein
MIGAGIIAALLVNSFVFPRHARVSNVLRLILRRVSHYDFQVLFLRDASESLRLMSSYYLELSR